MWLIIITSFILSVCVVVFIFTLYLRSRRWGRLLLKLPLKWFIRNIMVVLMKLTYYIFSKLKLRWLLIRDKFSISEDEGRLKDIIVRGGENIAPKEIEDLLNTHPDIIESQVVGVSDERLGEELCAVLKVRDGAKVTLEDVAKHCSGKVARFKIPRLLKITADFPKTGSGKIQKFKLRDLIEAGKL